MKSPLVQACLWCTHRVTLWTSIITPTILNCSPLLTDPSFQFSLHSARVSGCWVLPPRGGGHHGTLLPVAPSNGTCLLGPQCTPRIKYTFGQKDNRPHSTRLSYQAFSQGNETYPISKTAAYRCL